MAMCLGTYRGTTCLRRRLCPGRSIKQTETDTSLVGKCARGNTCPYTHDPLKVAICPQFMQNKCMEGDACDLSHEPTPHRVPACVHFLRGNCSNRDCRYAHIRVNPNAPVCKPFAVEGYCDKGPECTDRHVRNECPEYDEKGTCSNPSCKLQHVERAGRRRAAAVAAAKSASNPDDPTDDVADISSDEEDHASDDVDSDAYSEEEEDEEIWSSNQTTGPEVSEQMDYIHF